MDSSVWCQLEDQESHGELGNSEDRNEENIRSVMELLARMI